MPVQSSKRRETLRVEMKHLAKDEHEVDIREDSKLLAFLQFLGVPENSIEDENQNKLK